MKKQILVLMFTLSALVLSGTAVLAVEQMSPAKAAARKKAEEKLKKQGAPADTGAKSSAVDLNKSSKEQLMTLPGIGEAEADKIIAGRPYITKTQLRQKDILPSATFYEILDKVTVDITVKKYEPPAAPPAKKKDEKPEKKPDAPKKDVFKDFGK